MKKIISLIIIGIMFTGCTKTVIEYVPQVTVKEVPVPVILDIPKVHCDLFGDTEEEILNNMLKCIIDQKRVLDILSSKNNANKRNADEKRKAKK